MSAHAGHMDIAIVIYTLYKLSNILNQLINYTTTSILVKTAKIHA